MTQPFLNRENLLYHSMRWPEVSVQLHDEHLLLYSAKPLFTVSSALWGGGVGRATHFVNRHVSLQYQCEHPVEELESKIGAWGYPPEETVGMLTAVDLSHASILEEEGDGFHLLCCVTAGTGNAARAGRKRETFSAYRCGTINIFLLIDGNVAPSAMVNGIITATEAKAAALQDLKIGDEAGEAATGTTTDSVVIAASQTGPQSATHLFAGTATTLGNAIGRLVYRAVCEGLTDKEVLDR